MRGEAFDGATKPTAKGEVMVAIDSLKEVPMDALVVTSTLVARVAMNP